MLGTYEEKNGFSIFEQNSYFAKSLQQYHNSQSKYLIRVATMQQEKGSNPLSIYTASEYDIMEERHGVMQAIAALVPNHDERVQSIQVWPVDFLINLS